jgi:hypothetical protein
MMAKKSVETYLHFLRYYLLSALDICRNANHSPIQIDLIELYIRTALSLVNEISQTNADEDPNDITNEI